MFQETEQITIQREAFQERILGSVSGMFDIYLMYIGERLGFYDVLAADGALTAAELAHKSGSSQRYVQEWLEQQAVTGVLELVSGSSPHRFRLPQAHTDVLTDRDSLNYLAPLVRQMIGTVKPLDLVLQAFRTGEGIPFEEYGPDMREGESDLNRNTYLHELPQWIASIPDVHQRLQENPDARVADIGCGGGWAAIGLALAYPGIRVDGYDLDEPSIELARQNAAQKEVSDRVHFHVQDIADTKLEGHYDLVTVFECLHDMSDPVGALTTFRKFSGGQGAVIIGDMRVADTFSPPGTEVEHLMYGWSVLHCLPVGLAEQPSAATGTVMRPPILQKYAQQAGFRDVEILPIETFFWNIYRLVH